MNALISVSDKTGIVDLARALHALGVGLISTGGTAKLLEAGLEVRDISDLTGFPEMLDGRVKTLHPKVHGGLLARRDLPEHMAALKAHGIDTIDLLLVNLYPFEATVAKPGCTLEDAIENIDIGGPAMVRSAAKNWKDVAVLTDASQYAPVLAELQSAGKLSDTTRFALSVAAFNRISNYDAAISDYLSSLQGDGSRALFPAQSNGRFVKLQDLRYGENPHQQAAYYRDLHPAPGSLVTGAQLQGKELSYNNIADADAAWECVKTFDAPACVIVKHANPCGVAVGAHALEAYEKAFKTDPTSAFGGIIAFNRPRDGAAAQAVAKQFVEVLFAWKVAKYVKSNAIVFCKDGMTMGVGAGQMSRLDSARIASIKAQHAGLSLGGTAVASDAFFPFRDGLDVVVDAGASCVIQPGGSMRDPEVIAAADERGVVMVFSGVRHFRH